MAKVFHVVEPNFGFGPEAKFPEDFILVAETEADDLGIVFEKTNTIDQCWWLNPGVTRRFPAEGCRSTSVGDVVTVGDGRAFKCASSGWEPIDLESGFTIKYLADMVEKGLQETEKDFLEREQVTAEPKVTSRVVPSELSRAWKKVVSHLHWNGTRTEFLTVEEKIEVIKLGDGFGTIDTTHDGFWDWSHVRDCSDGSTLAMAEKISEFELERIIHLDLSDAIRDNL